MELLYDILRTRVRSLVAMARAFSDAAKNVRNFEADMNRAAAAFARARRAAP